MGVWPDFGCFRVEQCFVGGGVGYRGGWVAGEDKGEGRGVRGWYRFRVLRCRLMICDLL